jgi:hypothetical protein
VVALPVSTWLLCSCSFAPGTISWDDSEDVAGFPFLSKEEYVNSVDEEDGNCPVYIDREGNIINVSGSQVVPASSNRSNWLPAVQFGLSTMGKG